jgi:hypothetical protein
MKDQRKPKDYESRWQKAGIVVDKSLDKYSSPEFEPVKLKKVEKKFAKKNLK